MVDTPGVCEFRQCQTFPVSNLECFCATAERGNLIFLQTALQPALGSTKAGVNGRDLLISSSASPRLSIVLCNCQTRMVTSHEALAWVRLWHRTAPERHLLILIFKVYKHASLLSPRPLQCIIQRCYEIFSIKLSVSVPRPSRRQRHITSMRGRRRAVAYEQL